MGPCASIVLPSSLSSNQLATINDALDRIGDTPTYASQMLDLWINDTGPIGGSYAGEGRPFCVTPHTLNQSGKETDLSADELSQVQAEFDFTPQFIIDVSANCNGDEDHRILAEVCHYFASSFAGVVNFNGAILPREPALYNQAWPKIEPSFSLMVADLPPKIVSVPYITISGRAWVTHFCTPDFLKAWLSHPAFRMIK